MTELEKIIIKSQDPIQISKISSCVKNNSPYQDRLDDGIFLRTDYVDKFRERLYDEEIYIYDRYSGDHVLYGIKIDDYENEEDLLIAFCDNMRLCHYVQHLVSVLKDYSDIDTINDEMEIAKWYIDKIRFLK